MKRTNTNSSHTSSQIVVKPRTANVLSSQTNSEKSHPTNSSRKREPIFRAEVSSAQLFVFTLKGISTGKKDQHAYCEISEIGMKFTTTDSSLAAQGSALIKESVYDVWKINSSSPVCFRINLAVLLQCLGSLSPANLQLTHLKMAFFEEEECFSLQLAEGRLLTECKIKTMIETADSGIDRDSQGQADDIEKDMVDFAAAFSSVEVVNKGIVKSDQLRDAFSELSELPGAATVSVLMSPEAPFFRLRTQGQTASCEIDFPKGDETFTQLLCQKTMLCEYRLSLLQQAGKALSVSDKTFVRMNAEGTLSVQHMITHQDGQKTYVDYFILADIDQDENEDSQLTSSQ
mmetsp:Transcript_8027/g.9180  ORF Transcript_8027/g.9180 Transcript_8027/m.9180 type:complete len:345 (-) Transcript_8027:885-1919(-)